MDREVNKLKIFSIYLGSVVLTGMIIPFGFLLRPLTGGMYGSIFKGHAVIYHLFTLSLTYLAAVLFVYFIFKKMEIVRRLHSSYASPWLFLIGSFIVIFYLIIRVFASSIEGGGPAYVVSLYGVYPLFAAKICLYVAFVRLLIGIEPKIKEEYSELDVARQKAAKYLTSPLLIKEYISKKGIDRSAVDEMISIGEIKAYEYKGYLFIDIQED